MTDTLLFFQSGDFRDAFRRFEEGGEETYLDQRRSVDFVAELARGMNVVVASASDDPHDAVLAPRLRSIGLSRAVFWTDAAGGQVLEEVKATRIIPRIAHAGVLRRVRTSATPCFPTLADIFQPTSLRALGSRSGSKRWLRHRRLGALLSPEHTLAVGNHGLNASRSLNTELGLSLERILPWEWTMLEPDPAARTLGTGRLTVVYAGVVSEDKGVGDLVEAARLLREQGHDLDVTICGPGDHIDRLEAVVRSNGLEDRVKFMGRVPLHMVGTYMRECDIVVVPSRHEYPEGMPNVIFEALAARTPLVISDHPSFRGRLAGKSEAVIFEAANPRSLAAAIAALATDAALYRKISANSAQALRGLYVGTSWYRLVEQFLNDPSNRSGWVEAHSLGQVLAEADATKKEKEAHDAPH